MPGVVADYVRQEDAHESFRRMVEVDHGQQLSLLSDEEIKRGIKLATKEAEQHTYAVNRALSAFERFPNVTWDNGPEYLKSRASEIQTIASDTGFNITPTEAMREAYAEHIDRLAAEQRYERGYDHMKTKLTGEIQHISQIMGDRLDSKADRLEAIALARDANMRIHHQRNSPTSIYGDPDFRHGALNAVRDFVAEANESYTQRIGPRMRI